MSKANEAGQLQGGANALLVLLVDDEPRAREDGCALLSVWGITPVVACSGMEALRLVREHDFDIVLMDVAMPSMDGLQATEQIRHFQQENPARPTAAVVAYSSNDLALSESATRRMGLSDVLMKPSNITTMGTCLQRWGGARFSPPRPGAAGQEIDSVGVQTPAGGRCAVR